MCYGSADHSTSETVATREVASTKTGSAELLGQILNRSVGKSKHAQRYSELEKDFFTYR